MKVDSCCIFNRDQADSLLKVILKKVAPYQNRVESYDAQLYLKGYVNVLKHNRIIRFIPSMFKVRKGEREYLMESYSRLRYKYPDRYDRQVVAETGTVSNFWKVDNNFLNYFYLNPYSSSLLRNKLISPLAKGATPYYKFHLDSVRISRGDTLYRISFVPKMMSYQLLKGWFCIDSERWRLREFHFEASSEFLHCKETITMGEPYSDAALLPSKVDMDIVFNFLGNKIKGRYFALLKYDSISFQEPIDLPKQKYNKYDLTRAYSLSCTRSNIVRDSTFWGWIRPIDLNQDEKQLYQHFQQHKVKKKEKVKKSHVFWTQLESALFERYSFNMENLGHIRCSALLNPVLMSYRPKVGFSYRQSINYNKIFENESWLYINPRIGYNFKLKELYWNIHTDWIYYPQKNCGISMNVGSGNRIYNSRVVSEIKGMHDSIFDFRKIHLDYFSDLYANISHTAEIMNGLKLSVGLNLHHRNAVHGVILQTQPQGTDVKADDVGEPLPIGKEKLNIRTEFNSLALDAKIVWSPGQYYYMNGNRKINLHSKYPTLTIDWERALPHLMKHSGQYERIEMDLQHQFRIGLMRKLFWRVGFGDFTNRNELYFVDFVHLSRNNLPIGWNDEIGGVFQLLDSRWYNSSYYYARGHLTYESPFLLMPRMMKYSQHILTERIYASMLFMPHLHPYVELGYGLGTNIFDFGVFASFINGKYHEMGVKFTFELFNK